MFGTVVIGRCTSAVPRGADAENCRGCVEHKARYGLPPPSAPRRRPHCGLRILATGGCHCAANFLCTARGCRVRAAPPARASACTSAECAVQYSGAVPDSGDCAPLPRQWQYYRSTVVLTTHAIAAPPLSFIAEAGLGATAVTALPWLPCMPWPTCRTCRDRHGRPSSAAMLPPAGVTGTSGVAALCQ